MDRLLSITGESLPPLLRAFIEVTIPLTVVSFTFGMIIAVLSALARLSKYKILRAVSSVYTWFFRGTPLLVQLFIIFFGLPSLGIQLNAYMAAVITLSLNTGAYASENIRAALLAVPREQHDAGLSLGMSPFQVFRYIQAPQAFKIALPSLGNNLISLVKDTSLAASITVVEVFMTGQRIAARTYEPLLLYVLVALYYLIFCSLLNVLQERVEQKLAQPGQQ